MKMFDWMRPAASGWIISKIGVPSVSTVAGQINLPTGPLRNVRFLLLDALEEQIEVNLL